MVPAVDNAAAPLDANGYPRATEASGSLSWPTSRPGAVVSSYTDGVMMNFVVQRADPAAAPVPVCILTNAEAYVPSHDGLGLSTALGSPVDPAKAHPLGALAPGRQGLDLAGFPRDPGDRQGYVPTQWLKFPVTWR